MYITQDHIYRTMIYLIMVDVRIRLVAVKLSLLIGPSFPTVGVISVTVAVL